MTRKRYMKLLVACGHSRNDAALAARIVQIPPCDSYLRDLMGWVHVKAAIACAAADARIRDEYQRHAVLLYRAYRAAAKGDCP